MPRRSASISPTAHYTGYTWFRHGLSHPALVTPEGRVFYRALRPAHGFARLIGAPTLGDFLLPRHRVIDHLLHRAIEEGHIGQIIEVAAGLSPRGWRFKQRHGDKLRYIEADLPDMAARKLGLLREAGMLAAGHDVVALDALAEGGPLSLAALADGLDAGQGLAIVTEGLVNYFDTPTVTGMWRRFGQVLTRFPQGLYLSDIHLSAARDASPGVSVFMASLSAFVRGRVFLHFERDAVAEGALRDAGFQAARLHAPSRFATDLGMPMRPGSDLVRVIEAWTRPPA